MSVRLGIEPWAQLHSSSDWRSAAATADAAGPWCRFCMLAKFLLRGVLAARSLTLAYCVGDEAAVDVAVGVVAVLLCPSAADRFAQM